MDGGCWQTDIGKFTNLITFCKITILVKRNAGHINLILGTRCLFFFFLYHISTKQDYNVNSSQIQIKMTKFIIVNTYQIISLDFGTVPTVVFFFFFSFDRTLYGNHGNYILITFHGILAFQHLHASLRCCSIVLALFCLIPSGIMSNISCMTCK